MDELNRTSLWVPGCATRSKTELLKNITSYGEMIQVLDPKLASDMNTRQSKYKTKNPTKRSPKTAEQTNATSKTKKATTKKKARSKNKKKTLALEQPTKQFFNGNQESLEEKTKRLCKPFCEVLVKDFRQGKSPYTLVPNVGYVKAETKTEGGKEQPPKSNELMENPEGMTVAKELEAEKMLPTDGPIPVEVTHSAENNSLIITLPRNGLLLSAVILKLPKNARYETTVDLTEIKIEIDLRQFPHVLESHNQTTETEGQLAQDLGSNICVNNDAQLNHAIVENDHSQDKVITSKAEDVNIFPDSKINEFLGKRKDSPLSDELGAPAWKKIKWVKANENILEDNYKQNQGVDCTKRQSSGMIFCHFVDNTDPPAHLNSEFGDSEIIYGTNKRRESPTMDELDVPDRKRFKTLNLIDLPETEFEKLEDALSVEEGVQDTAASPNVKKESCVSPQRNGIHETLDEKSKRLCKQQCKIVLKDILRGKVLRTVLPRDRDVVTNEQKKVDIGKPRKPTEFLEQTKKTGASAAAEGLDNSERIHQVTTGSKVSKDTWNNSKTVSKHGAIETGLSEIPKIEEPKRLSRKKKAIFLKLFVKRGVPLKVHDRIRAQQFGKNVSNHQEPCNSDFGKNVHLLPSTKNGKEENARTSKFTNYPTETGSLGRNTKDTEKRNKYEGNGWNQKANNERMNSNTTTNKAGSSKIPKGLQMFDMFQNVNLSRDHKARQLEEPKYILVNGAKNHNKLGISTSQIKANHAGEKCGTNSQCRTCPPVQNNGKKSEGKKRIVYQKPDQIPISAWRLQGNQLIKPQMKSCETKGLGSLIISI